MSLELSRLSLEPIYRTIQTAMSQLAVETLPLFVSEGTSTTLPAERRGIGLGGSLSWLLENISCDFTTDAESFYLVLFCQCL